MGKVHGSLARAGKVRGQTPKVAKQDKKKKPRGRAHKRMQYNRRFVTAVVGFGKKRGPNSSENHVEFPVYLSTLPEGVLHDNEGICNLNLLHVTEGICYSNGREDVAGCEIDRGALPQEHVLADLVAPFHAALHEYNLHSRRTLAPENIGVVATLIASQ
ncbi:hypothetical protein CDL15_Pgr004489 [Punica granatum]|uniref:Uncharacterized protein n=1 Tax=Punica granatum TaxID=22663 RepID=A0A218WE70_PUNGR|nr:hypothetical protein CDL15_Pgr004489 [Punica granatum]